MSACPTPLDDDDLRIVLRDVTTAERFLYLVVEPDDVLRCLRVVDDADRARLLRILERLRGVR